MARDFESVFELADEQGIDFLPGAVLAALWRINRLPGTVNRKDPEAIAAHNASVLAAGVTAYAWAKDPSDGRAEEKGKFLRMATLGEPFPAPISAAFRRVISGAEGHTHPINPTARGTGLRRQEKAPKYDEGGHVI